MSNAVTALNADAIRQALDLLNRKLADRQVTAELCVFGGAVMALVFDARESTRDVDAIMVPKSQLAEAALEVSSQLGLPHTWLNDGVKGFVSLHGDYTEAGMPQFEHLRIMRPTAEYLLAMKCLAARSDVFDDAPDRQDALVLARHLGLTTEAEMLDIVSRFYPDSQLQAKTRYFVAELAQELTAN